MVESTALEMRRMGNRTVGSNPTLSANLAESARYAAFDAPIFRPRLIILIGRTDDDQ